MAGADLHEAVRGPITALHPDETVLWYRSTGQTNVKGKIFPEYADPVSLTAQVQSDGDEALRFDHRLGDAEQSRVFYLRSPAENRVAGLLRPDARNGDFLFRTAEGSWWLVTAVLEDFSSVSWEKVRGVRQVLPPDVPSPSASGGAA